MPMQEEPNRNAHPVRLPPPLLLAPLSPALRLRLPPLRLRRPLPHHHIRGRPDVPSAETQPPRRLLRREAHRHELSQRPVAHLQQAPLVPRLL